MFFPAPDSTREKRGEGRTVTRRFFMCMDTQSSTQRPHFSSFKVPSFHHSYFSPLIMKLAILLLSAAMATGFQLSKPLVARRTNPLLKIRQCPTSLSMSTVPSLTATTWRMPSTKVQIALAAHVIVIAVAFNILRFVLGHLISFVQGLVTTKKTPKDRVTIEAAYARRKRQEQENTRLAAWKKGQEREAAELRAQKKQQQKYVLPEIPKLKVVVKPTVQTVPVVISKQVTDIPMDGMNAAKKRELAAIADRKRQQAMILARPMDGVNAAKRQELSVIAQRKLQQDMMSRDHLSITREEEAEKNRKLTSMLTTAERDAKRLTESALADIKAKVADVVEQRLESEEKEEELRYAQEWAAAVAGQSKESSADQQKKSVYSVLSAVVGRGQRFFGLEKPSEEEALAMYQRMVKAQQQAAAVLNARSKGLALENEEQLAMKSRMLREEEEEIAIMEMEEHRQALDRAIRRKEAEEAAAAISYAKTVKRVEEAKRVRALNKGKALEQAGEYVRQSAPPVVTVLPTAPAAVSIKAMLKTAVGRAQRYFGMEQPTEEEALAMYQRKVKSQQQAAAVLNARSKGKALETAEEMAMKSQMLHEEAKAKALMEEEEDRQARATALRRKEAEEASAAVAYAKSMKRLDEAKRQRAINKLKALEQIEREMSYVRPPTSSVNAVSSSTVLPVAPTIAIEHASTSNVQQRTVSEQEALAMYAKSVKAEQAAQQLKFKQNKLLIQEQNQMVGLTSSSTTKGQEILPSTFVADDYAKMDEMEDERELAAALRRKLAEEYAAMEAYKKTVQKLKLMRTGNKLQSSSTTTSSSTISVPSPVPVPVVPVVNTQRGGTERTTYHWSPHNMIRGDEE